MKKACPNQNEGCKYYPECFSDTHHEAFPRRNYRSKLEREYRKATSVQVCREEHDEIHAEWWSRGEVPVKPTPGEMRVAIAKAKRGILKSD